MKLTISQNEREFEVYLHFAVLDPAYYLVAASFAGFQTAVKAVAAAIVSGFDGIIEANGETVPFSSYFGRYRRAQAPLNDELYHGVVIIKDAIFHDEPAKPVIIAPDGDVQNAAGRYLAARLGLPQEWISEYLDLFDEEDYEHLYVVRDTESPAWKDLKAVRLKWVTDEYVHNRIADALKSGRLVIPPAPVTGRFDPNWTVNEYLKANAPILAEQVSKTGALFTPGVDKISPHIATMGRLPFPAQAYVTQAAVKALEKKKAVFICGDMGTGKTQVANGVVHVLHKEKGIRRVLVTAPGIVVPKWAHEIRTTVPYARIRVLNSTQDALVFAREAKEKEPEGLEVVLASIDRTKLGPDPYCAAVWKRVRGAKYSAWHCPDCLKPLPAEEEYAEFVEKVKKHPFIEPGLYAGWHDLANGLSDLPDLETPKTPGGVPAGFSQWKRKSKLKKCPRCGARLWRPANKERGETRLSPRWFICRVLKNLGKLFDLYVADEIHQTKAHDSGRGYAFGQLVKCAKRVVGLTGTLTTGKSTSIKEALWRTNPAEQVEKGFGHGDAFRWAMRYGVLEKTYSKDDAGYADDGVLTVRRGKVQTVRELPGISPEMTATYLLDKAVFFELGDLGLPLVELKEIPVFVEMDPDHGEMYQMFHNRLRNLCSRAARAGAKGAFSVFIPATINYADLPYRGASVQIGNEVVDAPAYPQDYHHAKERKLIEIVREELAQNRGVVIYTRYSGAYGVNERLKDVLSAHGIESTILETSVGPDERMEWLEKEAQKGTRVIICNLELVEVGLDLIHWPTLIFYQLDYRVFDVRQASRRAWRIGQTRECRVYYLVYNKTQQMAQFKHVMAGRGHALFVEGRLDRSELARYALDERTSVAYDIAMCLAESDLAEKWVELSKKDIDENITVVSEEKFLAVLEETKKKLIEETLRLCGALPAAPEVPVTVPEEEIVFVPEEEDGALELFTGWTEQVGELFDPEKMELFPGWGRVEELPAAPAKRKRRRKKKASCAGQLTIFDFIEVEAKAGA